MQKRIHHLILKTIEYMKAICRTSYAYESLECALSDMERYAQYVDYENKDRLMISIDSLRNLVIRHDDFPILEGELELLYKSVKNMKSIERVDFIISRISSWGSARPLADAFIEAGCEVRLVPSPMLQEKQDKYGEELKRIVSDSGYAVLDFETYDIENELPDIVVDNMAVDCAKIPELRFLRIASVTAATVHLEHSILTGYNEAMKRTYFRIGRSRCWQYLVPSTLFTKALPLIIRIDGNYLAKGCPEFDTIYQIQHDFFSEDRTAILWNIDAMDPEYDDLPGDYERLEREIMYLEHIARAFPDIKSIVRTHPSFRNQPRCNKLMHMLTQLTDKYKNIVFDEETLIYSSYQKVSAMVTWASSTTFFTFGSTGKPLILLPSFIKGGYDTMIDMHLLDVIPIAYSVADMEAFVKGICNDTDRERRLAVLTEYTGPINGKASEGIAKEVLLIYEKQFLQ